MATFPGTPADDTLAGTDDADRIEGGAGDDTLSGLGGDDILIGGSGINVIDGGDGFDIVDYSDRATGITLLLNYPADKMPQSAGRESIVDVLTSIEGVIGSAFDDVLRTHREGDGALWGGDGDDVLNGMSGNSRLYGEAGDDQISAMYGKNILSGGAGHDRITGGSDNDVIYGDLDDISLKGMSGDDIVYVASGTIQDKIILDGWTGFDVLDLSALSENLVVTVVSPYTSTLRINGFEHIIAGSGNDVVAGYIYADILDGSLGNDVLRGAAGDDVLNGGAGADQIDGGEGFDTASYAGETAALTIDLAAGTSSQHDRLRNIEAVIGGSGDDTITGSAGDDVIDGGEGADDLAGGGGLDTLSYASRGTGVIVNLESGYNSDGDRLTGFTHLQGGGGNDYLFGDGAAQTLAGGAGDDVLRGGGGADRLEGGDGTDTASYADAKAGVDVDLAAGIGRHGDAEGDVLTAIENLSGSAFDDRLAGGATAGVLSGMGGNDVLSGGRAADRLDGGDGNDIVSYAGRSDAIAVDLASGANGDNDLLISIEGVEGGSGDDRLLGTASYDRLTGGDGDDRLQGGGSGDLLTGGDGADLFVFGSATDSLNTSIGRDRLTDFNAAEGDRIDLSAIPVSDGLANPLSFRGSAGYTGTAGEVRVTTSATAGYAAVSVDIDGDRRSDMLILVAGSPADIGKDALVLAGPDGVQYGTAGADAVRGEDGDDRLVGLAGDDVLIGGAGDDLLTGGRGADLLIGGSIDPDTAATYDSSANDLASYDASGLGVSIDLSMRQTVERGWAGLQDGTPVSLTDAVLGHGGDAEGDVLIGIDHLTGSAFDDMLTGDEAANHLSGGLGNDVLSGGGGDDMLSGGAGDDRLIGGAGQNIIDGGDGFDTVDYSGMAVGISIRTAGSLLPFSPGEAVELSDQLTGIEQIIGTDQADGIGGDGVIYGGGGDDVLWSGAGDDVIHAGSGSDIVNTGAGNDIVYGSLEDKQISLGSGDDILHLTPHGFTNISYRIDAGDGYDILDASDLLLGISLNLTANKTASGNPSLPGYVPADLTLSIGFEDVRGTGYSDVIGGGSDDDVDETFYGLDGNDGLVGGGGDDRLYGGSGRDSLTGGSGDDVLSGGLDADSLDGGAGADRFVYTAVTDSTVDPEGRDTILRFRTSEGDRIDLSGWDRDPMTDGVQGFTFIGSTGYHGIAGEIRVSASATPDYLAIGIDVDGDARSDSVILVQAQFGYGDISADSFLL